MFKCEHCHTEYGGIRGLSAASCSRCRQSGGDTAERRDWSTRPFAAAASPPGRGGLPAAPVVDLRFARRAG
jgi:hypothetical protein